MLASVFCGYRSTSAVDGIAIALLFKIALTCRLKLVCRARLFGAGSKAIAVLAFLLHIAAHVVPRALSASSGL